MSFCYACGSGRSLSHWCRQVKRPELVRQFAVMIILGLALTVGITRYATQLEHYTNLERIQRSRQDSATRGQSGFATQSDVD